MKIQCISSGSKGNCYLVDDGAHRILLECGVPFKKIQKSIGYITSSIGGCFITHEHYDHANCFSELYRRGIKIYSSKGTADALKAPYIVPLTPLEMKNIGDFSVLPFPVEHDAAEPFGYLIVSNLTSEKLLFVTDTKYCRYSIPGIDYIMCEANYDEEIMKENIISKNIDISLSNRIIKSHMSIQTAVDFIKTNASSNLKAVYLIHLSDRNSDEIAFKQRIQQEIGVPVYVY